jgi:TonB family protein
MRGPDQYPRPRSSLRPTPGTFLLAALLAGATISVVPLFGMLSAERHEAVDLRPAPDSSWVLAEPVEPRAERAEESRREDRTPPKATDLVPPRAEAPRVESPALAVAIPMNTLTVQVGEVALGFEFAPAPAQALPPPAAPPSPEPPEAPAPVPVAKPVPLYTPKPVYPRHLERRRLQGYVVLLIYVDADGRVSRDPTVLHSEPGDVFVPAAKKAVMRWRFRPATRGGRPVPSTVEQPFRFKP